MMKKEQVITLTWISLSALVGMALVVYATVLGPGVGGDATIYITSAKNLLAGNGLGWTEVDGSFRLLPYTPPFYPLMLSAVGLVFSDITTGARWLNVILFGATTFLLSWSFYRATRQPLLTGVLSGLLATSPVIVGVQVWAMSESVFLFTGFAGMLLLLKHFDCPRWRTLCGSAALIGLAFLARYIGVAFLLAGGLALLLMRRSGSENSPRRAGFRLSWQALREAFVFGLIAALPALIWIIIDYSLTGTVSSRSGQPADAYWSRFLEMGPALQKIFLFWLLPDSVINRLPGLLQTILTLLAVAAFVGLFVLLVKRAHPGMPAYRMAVVFGLFAVVYLIVLAGVQVFTYPPVTLAARMLSPVHMAALVLVFVLLHLLMKVLAPGSHAVAVVVSLAVLALLGTYALRGALVARDYHNNGIGYNAVEWRTSSTVEVLKKLPPEVPVISNEVTAVMYLTGRPAYALQEIYQEQPLETFTAYGEGDDTAQKVFREAGGALVLFKNALHDDFAMYGDRVDERIDALQRGLYLYYESEEGVIYFYDRPAFLEPEPCD